VFVGVLIGLVCLSERMPYRNPVSAQTRRKIQAKHPLTYACPMHPEVTSTKPGRCSKCGAQLSLVKAEPGDNDGPVTVAPGLISDTAAASIPRMPDIEAYDQNGKQLRFYTDLVKGKTVAINFIFTSCTNICPPLTSTFRRVQQGLAEAASDARLITISVDPTTDTPEKLLVYAAKFKAEPGWTFVTGEKSEIDRLLKALGFAVADKNDHSPMILIGNDAAGYWTKAYGLSSPTSLVKMISEVAGRK